MWQQLKHTNAQEMAIAHQKKILSITLGNKVNNLCKAYLQMQMARDK